MSSTKKKRNAPFSGSSFRVKFILLDILFMLALALSWHIMADTIEKAASEKYDRMEKTAVTATEQMTSTGIDSAVSIAKNIYTNKPVYDFLNKSYSSSSEYFEAYQPLLKNTALNTADTNIVKKCTIYTSNPTILPGGTLGSLDQVRDEEWYKSMKKFNKPTVLSIDHSDQSIMLVRKLDYIPAESVESYLCLKISSDFIRNFAESLDFDGSIFIMSGSDLLYSSDESVKAVSDITITPQFKCVKRNYYTVDIEFYSCADRTSTASVLMNGWFLPCVIGIVVLFNIAVAAMAFGITRRIRPVLEEFRREGSIHSLSNGNNGRDEVGKLLDVCSEMAERLTQKGSEYKESSDSLMKKSSEYNSLFTTAMRMDAELTVINKLPYLHTTFISNDITLTEEAEMIEEASGRLGGLYRFTGKDSGKIRIPAYSLVLLTENIFTELGGDSVEITASEKGAVITFEGSRKLRSTDTLKLLAIFEDESVTSEYSFDKNYRYNPYLRIRHCLGGRIDMDISTSSGMRITFRIKPEK
ncbi:MAG: cache domain-containing protein [Ruminococcus sp.]|nr:cache domain-containing protein [Ruminococcus sp.]HRR76170.1 hypothetical protein [Ruminococcus sp.]